jgi:glycogen synthase
MSIALFACPDDKGMTPPWPQKILFVTAPYLPSLGGVQMIVASLAREFSQRGHDVTVMTAQSSNQPDLPPIRVVRQPKLLEAWREFARADVVFQFGDGIRLSWPMLLRKRNVVTVHQIWRRPAESESRLGRALRQRMIKRSVNICPSRVMAERLGAPSEIIGNPYDESVFRLRPELRRQRDILFVGRLIHEKGADLLIDAIASLARDDARPSVTIVGAGPELESLHAQVKRLGLAEQVEFRGGCAPEQVARIMNEHRILVVPSRWEEPFGIVALEGLACGCTVIASDGGGLPDAVGACGLLFKRESAESMAACLAKAVNESRPIVEAPAATQLHLSRFTASAIANDYHTLARDQFSSFR